MTHVYRYGFLAVAIANLLNSGVGLAADVRTKDPAGFSEISVPQVKGTIPLGRLPSASDPKAIVNANGSQPVPNQPVRCGPENAQSEDCKAK